MGTLKTVRIPNLFFFAAEARPAKQSFFLKAVTAAMSKVFGCCQREPQRRQTLNSVKNAAACMNGSFRFLPATGLSKVRRRLRWNGQAVSSASSMDAHN